MPRLDVNLDDTSKKIGEIKPGILLKYVKDASGN
jgi:hypothetical protein